MTHSDGWSWHCGEFLLVSSSLWKGQGLLGGALGLGLVLHHNLLPMAIKANLLKAILWEQEEKPIKKEGGGARPLHQSTSMLTCLTVGYMHLNEPQDEADIAKLPGITPMTQSRLST